MIMITECQRLRFKAAGYTHYVSYKEWKESYGSYLTAGFPTTQDALKEHLKSIKFRDTVELTVIPL